MAEAYYGIPEEWKNRAVSVLKEKGCREEDLAMIMEFQEKYIVKVHAD